LIPGHGRALDRSLLYLAREFAQGRENALLLCSPELPEMIQTLRAGVHDAAAPQPAFSTR
jgi:hypothetical protein